MSATKETTIMQVQNHKVDDFIMGVELTYPTVEIETDEVRDFWTTIVVRGTEEEIEAIEHFHDWIES